MTDNQIFQDMPAMRDEILPNVSNELLMFPTIINQIGLSAPIKVLQAASQGVLPAVNSVGTTTDFSTAEGEVRQRFSRKLSFAESRQAQKPGWLVRPFKAKRSVQEKIEGSIFNPPVRFPGYLNARGAFKGECLCTFESEAKCSNPFCGLGHRGRGGPKPTCREIKPVRGVTSAVDGEFPERKLWRDAEARKQRLDEAEAAEDPPRSIVHVRTSRVRRMRKRANWPRNDGEMRHDDISFVKGYIHKEKDGRDALNFLTGVATLREDWRKHERLNDSLRRVKSNARETLTMVEWLTRRFVRLQGAAASTARPAEISEIMEDDTLVDVIRKAMTNVGVTAKEASNLFADLNVLSDTVKKTASGVASTLMDLNFWTDLMAFCLSIKDGSIGVAAVMLRNIARSYAGHTVMWVRFGSYLEHLATIAVVGDGVSRLVDDKYVAQGGPHVSPFVAYGNLPAQASGSGSTFSDVTYVMATLGASPISTKLRTLAGLVVGSMLFPSLPPSVRGAVDTSIQVGAEILTFSGVLGTILDIAHIALERVQAAWATGNVAELLAPEYSVQVTMLSRSIVDDVASLSTGSTVLDQAFKDKVDAKAKQLQNALRHQPVKDPVSIRAAADALAAINFFNETLRQRRRAPVAYILVGEPGTGKSQFVHQLNDALVSMYELNPGMSVTFEYLEDQTFQKVVVGAKIWALQDGFGMKDEYNKAGMLSTLQSVCDTGLYVVSAASLEEKARSMMAPTVVIVTTNSISYTMSKSTGGADKLNRRYKIARFQWTARARALAAEAGLTNMTTFNTYYQATLADVVDFSDLVEVVVGRMNNLPNTNVVKLEPSDPEAPITIREFLIRVRNEEWANVHHQEEFVTKCPWGIQYDRQHTVATCDDGKGPLCRPPHIMLQGGAQSAPRSCDADFGLEHEEKTDAETPPSVSYFDLAAQYFKLFKEEYVEPKFVMTVEQEAMYTSFSQHMKEYGQWYATVAVLISSITILVRTCQKTEEHSVEQGTIHTRVNGIPEVRIPVPETKTAVTSWVNRAAEETRIRIKDHEGRPMFATVITGRFVALPRHFFFPQAAQPMPEGAMISVSLTTNEEWRSFKFCSSNLVVPNPAIDLAIFRIEQVLLSAPVGVYESLPLRSFFPPQGSKITVGGNDAIVHAEYMYTGWNSGPGSCGQSVMYQGHHVGIHIGYFPSSHIRLCVPLSREVFDKAKTIFATRGVACVAFVPHLTQGGERACQHLLSEPPTKGQGNLGWMLHEAEGKGMRYIGRFKSADTSQMTGRPSPLYSFVGHLAGEMCPPNTRSAKLSPAGEYVGATVDKYRIGPIVTTPIDPGLVRKVYDDYLERIPECEVRLQPISLHQVLCGDPANKFISGRDVEKAIGPSLKAMGVTKANSFVEQRDGSWNINPTLVREYEEVLSYLERGEAPLWIASATYKDELLPKEKVANGKGRLFYVCDLVLNLHMRRLLLPLAAHILEHPFETGVFGTANPGGPDWGEIARYLLRNDTLIFDADQTKFDHRRQWLIDHHVDFIFRLARKLGYEESDAIQAAVVMAMASTYCLFVEGNAFYMTTEMCSGRMDTLWTNSTDGHIMVAVVLLDILRSKGKEELVAQNVFTLFNDVNTGDDNATSYSKEVYALLTGDELQRGHAGYGYILTDSAKNPKLTPKDISAITYLKRSFEFREGCWYGPLAKASIYKALAYQTNSKVSDEQRALSVLNMAYREFYLHGKATFDEFTILMRGVLNHKPLRYEDLDNEFKTNTFRCWSEMTIIDEPEIPFTVAFEETLRYQRQEPLVHQLGPPVLSAIIVERTSPETDLHLPCTRASDCFFVEHRAQASVHPVRLAWRSESLISSSASINDGQNNVETTTDTPTIALGGSNREQEHTNSQDPMPQRTSDDKIDLRVIHQRPRKIYTYSTTADTQIDVHALWYALPAVSSTYSQYGLYNGKAIFRVQYTGNPTLIGMIRFAFYPIRNLTYTASGYEFGTEVYPWTLGTMGGAEVPTSQAPHLDVDLSLSCQQEIELPWYQSIEYLPMAIGGWTCTIFAITSIQSAMGLTPAAFNMDLFYSYEALRVERLIPQGGELPGGLLSRALAYGARVAELATNFISPVQAALRTGAQLASSLGFSRPSEPISQKVIIANAPSFHAEGENDFSFTLGSSPNIYRSVMPDRSETKVLNIARRWSQLDDYVSFYPETLAVEPCAYIPGAGASKQQTPLSFISLAFARYTGSLEYRVIFPASPLIRWRVGILIVPPGVAVPAAFPSDNNYLAHIVEVVGTTEFEFTVPYLHTYPFREVQLIGLGSGTISNTRIVFYSLTPVTAPAATPPTIHSMLWVRAGPDYSLMEPCLSEINDHKFVNQGGLSGTGVSGEVVDDIRMLMKQPCLHGTMYTSSTGDPGTITVPADGFYITTATGRGTNPQYSIVGNQRWSFDLYFRTPFLGYSGGTNWRFVLGYLTRSEPVGKFSDMFMALQGWGGWNDEVNSDYTSSGTALFEPIYDKDLICVSAVDRSPVQWKVPVTSTSLTGLTDQWRSVCLKPVFDDDNYTAATWAFYQCARDDRELHTFLCCYPLYTV